MRRPPRPRRPPSPSASAGRRQHQRRAGRRPPPSTPPRRPDRRGHGLPRRPSSVPRGGLNDTPASRRREVVDVRYTNRPGDYAFTELEKVEGENQFKIRVRGGDGPREEGEFARLGAWFGTGGYEPAVRDHGRAAGPSTSPCRYRRHRRRGHQRGRRPSVSPDVGFLDADGKVSAARPSRRTAPTRPRCCVRAPTKSASATTAASTPASGGRTRPLLEDAARHGQARPDRDRHQSAPWATSSRPIERPRSGLPWVGKALSPTPAVGTCRPAPPSATSGSSAARSSATGSLKSPRRRSATRLTRRVTAENGSFTTARRSGRRQDRLPAEDQGQGRQEGQGRRSPRQGQARSRPRRSRARSSSRRSSVKDDGDDKYKKIGKGKIKKGKGTVSLRKLKKGKHKLVFFFNGKGKVGSATSPRRSSQALTPCSADHCATSEAPGSVPGPAPSPAGRVPWNNSVAQVVGRV